MHKALKYLPIGICAWYVLLIGWHFANQRPLWMDEGWVLSNIKQFSSADLFKQRLIHDQAFPKVYLWVIKQFSSLFDHAPWSLRLFPFICMVVAFGIWMRIAYITLSHHLDRVNFVLSWAASIPLIYYAAELKPYSMDVLAGSVLVFLLLCSSQGKFPSMFLCLFPLFGFYSYPALYLMFILLIVLWKKRSLLWCYIAMCLAVCVSVYFIDFRYSASHLLETYWHDYFISFASIPAFFQTLGEGINNTISRWFVEDPKIFRALSRPFVGIGLLWMLWQGSKALKVKSWVVPSIALMVFIELLILGALRKVPFTVPRISLFFAPMLFMCMVLAFSALRTRFAPAYWVVQVLFWIYVGVATIGIAGVIYGGDLGAQTKIYAASLYIPTTYFSG